MNFPFCFRNTINSSASIFSAEQLHAHEVLHMMEGNSYSEASLKEAIVKTFGEDQRFYTCSAENMDADELIVFLKQKGKFMPIENGFGRYYKGL